MYNYQYSELIRNNRTVSQYSRTGDSWHVVGWHGFCAAHDSGCVPLQWCCGHDISPVVPMTLALWPWHWPCGAYDTGFVVCAMTQTLLCLPIACLGTTRPMLWAPPGVCGHHKDRVVQVQEWERYSASSAYWDGHVEVTVGRPFRPWRPWWSACHWKYWFPTMSIPWNINPFFMPEIWGKSEKSQRGISGRNKWEKSINQNYFPLWTPLNIT